MLEATPSSLVEILVVGWQALEYSGSIFESLLEFLNNLWWLRIE
jgi:hypothetical protein